MTTLANLITYVSQDLRDSSNATFSTTEVTDLINRGIDVLGSVFPREIVSNSTTISSGVTTYALPTGMTYLYRADIYTDAGSYYSTLGRGTGEGPDSGWETHADTLYLPPNLNLSAGYTLRLWGYGNWTQLSVSSATTDLSTTAQWALRLFCQSEALGLLLIDRAKFQQWQTASNNTDVSAIGVAQLYQIASRRWEREVSRLRRLRKTG